MATVYVSSVDGNNTDNGSTWALADATLAASLTAAGAGGTSYVDNAHNESAAANITLASPGTAASPTKAICVSRSTGEPPTATATTGVVASGGNFNLTLSGFLYAYGLTFRVGTGTGQNSATLLVGTNSNAAYWFRFEQCVFDLNTTSTTVRLNIAGANANFDDRLVEFINTTLKFGSTSQGILVNGDVTWRGGSVDASGSAPTALFLANTGATATCTVLVEDVDLSALVGSSALVNLAQSGSPRFLFRRCKLGSSVAITTGTHPGQGGPIVELIECDSADTNYRFYRQTYEATEQQETTIVRSGGASDGTTAISRKIVTSANVSTWKPYETMPVTLWCSAVSTTISIPTVTDGVTLTDADAWIEVEYLGTSGNPLGVIASDRVSDPIFGSAANQTTDSTSTWTTTGLTSPVKQTLSVTFTPQKSGLVRAKVCVAKASTTIYYDPKILSTSARQYMSVSGVVNEGASSSSSTGVSRSRVVNC